MPQNDAPSHPGPLALVGGAEWTEGCSFDRGLLEESGGEVLILPTAAAYEHPEKAVARAKAWFSALGGRATALMVLARGDAEDERSAEVARASRCIYLGGGSPLHLRSVLKASKVWGAIFEAWEGGAVVAGASAGAMVITDPMVDPRGGAFTLGLGLIEQLAVIPHYGDGDDEKVHRRTVALAPQGLPVVGLPERTALIRRRDGTWEVEGQGQIQVFMNGERAAMAVLPN